MWPIARELAEDWAKDQQGLAAQISSLADKMLMVGLRLPEFLDKAETAFDALTHPPAPPKRSDKGKTATYLLLGSILVFLVIIVHRM